MSVVLIALDENGADATTSFIDQSASAHTLTANGDFQWDTAQAPSGLTSSGLADGTGDYLQATTHTDFGFGAGDGTVEFWWRFNVNTGTQVFVDMRDGGGSGLIFFSDAGSIVSYFGGIIISSATPAAGTWRHFAYSRVGGVSAKNFIDGTQVGSTYSDPGFDYGSTVPVRIGEGLNGWIAAVRITKGTALYTANFTPPSLPLVAGVSVLDEDGEWIITTQNW